VHSVRPGFNLADPQKHEIPVASRPAGLYAWYAARAQLHEAAGLPIGRPSHVPWFHGPSGTQLAPSSLKAMIRKIEQWIVCLVVTAALVVVSASAYAGSSSLPPDVDLDPDRGMTFGRLPKTSFDRRVFDPMKRALTSQAMDPAIDPYNSTVKASRYEPGTGKIRDSLTDKVRDLRRDEETARKNRAAMARREDRSTIGKLPKRSSPHSTRLPTTKKNDD